ncbi:MAG: FHIPEP family type III secretion protein, partial [Spirochaetales bacterium]|nr:FHIPEP family type III secretion protein [Spirochaetales bacterium]
IAVQNYIPLTIGDGLVSQIPSLLIGVATGLIVTRSQADDAIGTQVAQQLIKDYRIFLISGAVMAVLAILPGFPHIVLIILAMLMFGAAYLLNRSQTRKAALEKKKQGGEAGTQAGAASAADNTEELIKDDTLSLLIGYELIPLLDKTKGGELLSSISSTRGQVAIATGVAVPKIRIKDNLQLQSNEYEIKIKGQTVAKYSVIIDRLLAIGNSSELGVIKGGIKTHDPAYGNEAYWITDDMTESAEAQGYSVVDASAVICTHIQEVLRSHMDEILTRENVKQMIEGIRVDSPTIASEIDRMYQTLAPIQNVLKILLQEDVPVRDKETIFEILTDNPATTPPFKMAELIRQSLKRAIVTPYLTDNNELFVMKIDPRIEQALFKDTQYTDLGEPIVQLSANESLKFKQLFIEKMDKMRADGYYPIIQTAPEIRRAVWNLLRSNDAKLSVAVISNMEIPTDISVCLYGVISAQSKAA